MWFSVYETHRADSSSPTWSRELSAFWSAKCNCWELNSLLLPTVPSFLKTKMPIFFISRKAWKLRQFVQPEICKDYSDIWPFQRENCFGCAIGSWDQLTASTMVVLALTRRASLEMSEQKSLRLWISLLPITQTSNIEFHSSSLDQPDFVTNVISNNYEWLNRINPFTQSPEYHNTIKIKLESLQN